MKHNEPGEDFKEEVERKKAEVHKLLQETDGNFKATKETFDSMIAKFKKSGKRNYDFLTKAGPQFQYEIFKFCLRMFEEEDFPEEFQNTTLHMVFKGGKGRKEILSDSRFIIVKIFGLAQQKD